MSTAVQVFSLLPLFLFLRETACWLTFHKVRSQSSCVGAPAPSAVQTDDVILFREG